VFTGLVQEVGRLAADPAPSAGGSRLLVAHGPALGARLALGASVAVAGVCLTAVEPGSAASAFDLAPETVRRTRLALLRRGARVNLEPALRAGDEMGGHWVQGHVDSMIEVVARKDLGAHRELTFALPAVDVARVVEKGSVALDGVSLTVAGCDAASFRVALIPHTLAMTTLGELVAGDRVHVEWDVLGKYVERWLATRPPGPPIPPIPKDGRGR
jgi:riboflavin synthase